VSQSLPEFQLGSAMGFLLVTQLAMEMLFCALIFSLASGLGTEWAKPSFVLAMPWGTGWVWLSWSNVSDACASELALVSAQKSF